MISSRATYNTRSYNYQPCLFDLSAISYRQKFYLRPLLYTSKVKIQDYLQSIKQDWIEDSSNQEDNYTRNSIRKHLLPAMQNTLSFKESQTAETAPNKFLEKMLALHKEAIELKKIYQTQTADVDFRKAILLLQSYKPYLVFLLKE